MSPRKKSPESTAARSASGAVLTRVGPASTVPPLEEKSPAFQIAKRLSGGVATMVVQSHEERRVIRTLLALADRAKAHLVVWRDSTGFVRIGSPRPDDGPVDFTEAEWKGAGEQPTKPINGALRASLDWVRENKSPTTYFAFLDLHRWTERADVVRMVRDMAQLAPSTAHRVFMVSGVFPMPNEWTTEVDVFNFPIVGEVQLTAIVDAFVAEAVAEGKIAAPPSEDTREGMIRALRGLTYQEAETVLSVGLFAWHRGAARGTRTAPDLTDDVISYLIAEKQERINGIAGLRALTPTVTFDRIGGYRALKRWLMKVRRAFSREYRLQSGDAPKGVLLLGPPGTGKTDCAQAIAAYCAMPYFELNFADLYSGLLGASESRLSQALERIEAQAPCVLRVDEIEKALSGTGGGELNGGTSDRMLMTFLQWLSRRREEAVFVCFTANRSDALPPELLRAGRLDAKWVLLPPSSEARREILRIHLRLRQHNPDSFDGLDAVADAMEGYTGAEIEQVVKEAKLTAFCEGDGLTVDHLREAIDGVTPTMRSPRGKETLETAERYISDGFARNADEEDSLSLP